MIGHEQEPPPRFQPAEVAARGSSSTDNTEKIENRHAQQIQARPTEQKATLAHIRDSTYTFEIQINALSKSIISTKFNNTAHRSCHLIQVKHRHRSQFQLCTRNSWERIDGQPMKAFHSLSPGKPHQQCLPFGNPCWLFAPRRRSIVPPSVQIRHRHFLHSPFFEGGEQLLSLRGVLSIQVREMRSSTSHPVFVQSDLDILSAKSQQQVGWFWWSLENRFSNSNLLQFPDVSLCASDAHPRLPLPCFCQKPRSHW